nr:fasciclin-3-like isoform X1 [Onthophagus taurus]
MISLSIFKWIVIFTTIFAGGLGLRDVNVIIPLSIERGDKAIMKCLYDLEGEALYAVKWYKGGKEFFRYAPKETPSMKHFPIAGLRVIEYESNATQVVLDNVQLENSGDYLCEVTADGPGFYTREVNGELQVVISPREDPKITKINTKYRLGEALVGQCTSKDSKPAANLTWYINGKPAKQIHTRHQKPKTNEFGLETAVSNIRQIIAPELFAEGRLKIKCSAIIYDVYHRSFEMSIELDKPKPRYAITMSTPATMGFSGSNIHETYPYNTFRLSPIDDATIPSRTPKHPSNLILILFLLILVLLRR